MSKKKEEKIRSVGRPSKYEDEELQEKYISIWCSHFFRKMPIWELTKEYNCSKHTVKNAITFVNKEFPKLKNKELLQGALFAIRERIKRLTTQLEKELEKSQPATRSIVELNREIREEQRDEMKLENIYREKYSIEVEAGGSVKQILKGLSENKKQ